MLFFPRGKFNRLVSQLCDIRAFRACSYKSFIISVLRGRPHRGRGQLRGSWWILHNHEKRLKRFKIDSLLYECLMNEGPRVTKSHRGEGNVFIKARNYLRGSRNWGEGWWSDNCWKWQFSSGSRGKGKGNDVWRAGARARSRALQ